MCFQHFKPELRGGQDLWVGSCPVFKHKRRRFLSFKGPKVFETPFIQCSISLPYILSSVRDRCVFNILIFTQIAGSFVHNIFNPTHRRTFGLVIETWQAVVSVTFLAHNILGEQLRKRLSRLFNHFNLVARQLRKSRLNFHNLLQQPATLRAWYLEYTRILQYTDLYLQWCRACPFFR